MKVVLTHGLRSHPEQVINDKGEADSSEEDQLVGSQVLDIQVPITTRM